MKRLRKGRVAAASSGQRKAEQSGEEESDRSEDADVGEPEDGVIDVVRVDEDEEELQWHEVIDVVLHVGGALAKEKQRRLMERRRKGVHRKTPSTVTIEPLQDEKPE